jgi:phosphate transport system substrate-binding protein
MIAGCTKKEDVAVTQPLLSSPAPDESIVERIKPEEYPLTQGSNPTIRISEELFTKFTGYYEAETSVEKIKHTGTSESYIDFMKEGSKYEMIIAQQPDPETEKELQGTLFKPIAKDALVFITNRSNPVNRLSIDEIKRILSGEITNWKSVGGRDESINLFRRNESGGSQILLDKYVLKGAKMTNVPKKNITNDMSAMSNQVAMKTSEGSTFGYTTYYFSEYVHPIKEIKTIEVEGIKADYNTLYQNQYPIISNIYMGIKDAGGPAGNIYHWITSEEGQKLIGDTGYVPVK